MDHHAPPRSPDGGIGIPRNEAGLYRPESWMQFYKLLLAMMSGEIPKETAYDLSALPKLIPLDEIVSANPMTVVPPGMENFFRWEYKKKSDPA